MRPPTRALAIAALAAMEVACASALRDHAARHSPLRASPAPPESIAPAMKGVPLLNPLECLGAIGAAAPGCADPLCLLVAGAVLVGCTGVYVAVDALALPIQLPIRARQWSDLEAIAASCAIEDPVRQVADRTAARMVEDLGFGRDAGQLDAPDGTGALVLAVRTEGFTRSDRVRWRGRLWLKEPNGTPLWTGGCDAEAPERSVESIRGDCGGARAEVEALADTCAAQVVRDLRETLRPPSPTSSPDPSGARY